MADETLPLPLVEQLYDSPVELLPLLNSIPMPVVLLSREKRVLLLNRPAQALTGFTQEEAEGLPCRHVLRSSLCVRGCPLDSLQAEDRAVVHEADIINKLRQRIPVRATQSPALTARGRLAGYIECIEDLRPFSEMATRQQAGFTFGRIVGRSPQMERLFQLVPSIASSDSSVLVTGETGTGKDLLAEAIHQASPRAKGPFVKVNCGALPETLLESELFGHRKGAFTGATENKPGRFQLAHNGTLFLTEIGDLPLTLQVKLLTFLDDRVISPLGGSMPVPVNVRLIAATHRNLEEMVRQGTFRQDLFFRLNVVRLHIPALRDREEDVALLLDHFLRRINEEFKKHVQTLSDEARDVLLHYPYPGNVRELRNIIEYAVNVCSGSRIEVIHLPTYLLEQSGFMPPGLSRLPEHSPLPAHPPQARSSAVHEGDAWSDTEKRMILQALAQARGRRGKAAELLGWGRSTLWRKMKQYGLDS
ncbi:sigma-54 interaction domain-containing protein [Megalodesulfovibrio paquesii]